MVNGRCSYIVIHCSDSDVPAHDNIDTIDSWHKERGWKGCGYQYFVATSGGIFIGRQDYEVGAHTKDYNSRSIGICLHGKTEFTQAQYDSTKKLVRNLMHKYNLEVMDVVPHSSLNKDKTCPNFDINLIL